MERCARCSRSEDEVRLFDGIYVNDVVRICEKCSLISNIPLIKRPNVSQLKDSEKPLGVRARLMRMNHLDIQIGKEKSLVESMQELEANPELEKPEDLVFKLVDNFHWVIQTERRRKGITTRQLADMLGESEGAIKLLEKGIIPTKSLNLINAIEQFLKIKLVKRDLLSQQDKNPADSKILSLPSKSPFKKNEEASFLDKMKKEEGEDMVKEAILEEKNPVMKKIERAGSYPLPASEFRKREGTSVNEIIRRSERVENDFSYNKKSSAEVGREQVESIGKEDTSAIKRKLYGEKPRPAVPTIYDLMKKKEEKEKQTLTGKDIDLSS
jgi:ribosome-binding protein aMBF1 (putative translation factor)